MFFLGVFAVRRYRACIVRRISTLPVRAFPGPKLFLRHANALGDLHLEVRTNEREEKRRKGGRGKRSRGGGEKRGRKSEAEVNRFLLHNVRDTERRRRENKSR